MPELKLDTTRSWLLPPVYQRLQRGEGEFLAELRPAVSLFLKYDGINYHADDEAGAKLDGYVRWVQSVLARYEGYLVQLTMGDKGSYLYVVFGAPLAHDDDAARAVAAALDLCSPPPELDFIRDVGIGISHGQMRVGGYGGPMRRTYGVLGKEANIAARLMALAEPGQILVTPHVRAATAEGYDFEALDPIHIKGRLEPTPVFAVRGRRLGRMAGDIFERSFPTPMVGRAAERAVLAGSLRALLDGKGGTIVIEGGGGIGKSRLLDDLLRQAHALVVPRLVGAGEAIEATTAYYAWRPVFRQLFGLGDTSDTATLRRQVLDQLEDSPHLLERAPLLNAVLPVNLPENDLTAQMTGEVRAHNTRDLLVSLLQRTQHTVSVLLIVLEDAHWLDSASWALALAASQRVERLLLVLVTRPLTDPIPDEYRELLNAPDARHLELGTLPRDDILALVRQSLDVSELPPEVAELIYEKAEGHPFFSEELAYALRDTGLITVADGVARLAPDAHDLSRLNLPDTVQGVIASRLYQLSPSQQLTLSAFVSR